MSCWDGVQLIELMSQIGHQLGAQMNVDSGGRQNSGDFFGAVCVASSEPIGFHGGIGEETLLALEFLKMSHGDLQNVGLFQLGDVLLVHGQGGDHQLLELVQAPVDAGPTFPFQQRLHHLAVLHGLGHRFGVQGRLQIVMRHH